MQTITANWPTGPVTLSWTADPSSDLPVTGSHGFCFHSGRVLVCDIRGRGWSIPGGHMEQGETARDCLVRELREEACADLDRAELLGFMVVDHAINGSYVANYPMRSALAMFSVALGELRPYVPSSDALSRRLLDPDELPRVHHSWDAILDEAYREARRRIVACPVT